MKAGIHPAYNEINVICACGHTFKTRSTHKGDIRVEICSSCHPFFTGKQKLMDTAGRIDRFEKKYKVRRAEKKAANRPRSERRPAIFVAGIKPDTGREACATVLFCLPLGSRRLLAHFLAFRPEGCVFGLLILAQNRVDLGHLLVLDCLSICPHACACIWSNCARRFVQIWFTWSTCFSSRLTFAACFR